MIEKYYEILGLTLGLLSLIATLIFYFWVIDPETEKSLNQKEHLG